MGHLGNMTIFYKVKIIIYILGSLLPKNRSFELQVKQPKNLAHLYPFEFIVCPTLYCSRYMLLECMAIIVSLIFTYYNNKH